MTAVLQDILFFPNQTDIESICRQAVQVVEFCVVEDGVREDGACATAIQLILWGGYLILSIENRILE